LDSDEEFEEEEEKYQKFLKKNLEEGDILTDLKNMPVEILPDNL
jgi:hypothetical protein